MVGHTTETADYLAIQGTGTLRANDVSDIDDLLLAFDPPSNDIGVNMDDGGDDLATIGGSGDLGLQDLIDHDFLLIA